MPGQYVQNQPTASIFDGDDYVVLLQMKLSLAADMILHQLPTLKTCKRVKYFPYNWSTGKPDKGEEGSHMSPPGRPPAPTSMLFWNGESGRKPIGGPNMDRMLVQGNALAEMKLSAIGNSNVIRNKPRIEIMSECFSVVCWVSVVFKTYITVKAERQLVSMENELQKKFKALPTTLHNAEFVNRHGIQKTLARKRILQLDLGTSS